MWAVFERNKNITAAENQLHISKFMVLKLLKLDFITYV